MLFSLESMYIQNTEYRIHNDWTALLISYRSDSNSLEQIFGCFFSSSFHIHIPGDMKLSNWLKK